MLYSLETENDGEKIEKKTIFFKVIFILFLKSFIS